MNLTANIDHPCSYSENIWVMTCGIVCDDKKLLFNFAWPISYVAQWQI